MAFGIMSLIGYTVKLTNFLKVSKLLCLWQSIAFAKNFVLITLVISVNQGTNFLKNSTLIRATSRI